MSVPGLDRRMTQEQFGDLVGISQQAVSDLVAREIVKPEATAARNLIAYCDHLREVAAGREAKGDLDLVTERARLAKLQADRVELQNQRTRREVAPTELLELSIAAIGRQIKGRLEAIPVALRRRSTAMTPEDFAFVESEIAAVANLAAEARLDWTELESTDDSDAA